jgi:nitric oxide reductase subunit C
VFKLLVFLLLFFIFLTYSFIVYTNGTESINGTANGKANEGKMLFQKYNCVACHQIYGLGGYLGPELTTVMMQPGEELYVRSVLKYGTVRMPDFHLNENETDALVAFLKYTGSLALNNKTKN